MNLKGTKSEKNIKAALTGESLARNRYTFYAMQAQKEGHTEIAEMYERMAKNESMHAKIWFSILNDGLGTTKENLMESAKGENGEWMTMYPEFAKTAREEGLEELAVMFEKVADIEKDHEKTFLKNLMAMMASEKSKEEVVEETVATLKDDHHRAVSKPGYRCMFCGAVYEDRPDVCNVCGAIGSFERCMIEE
ncbi:MAG: rubrerythrin family protein [Anaerotignaceae bacterium]